MQVTTSIGGIVQPLMPGLDPYENDDVSLSRSARSSLCYSSDGKNDDFSASRKMKSNLRGSRSGHEGFGQSKVCQKLRNDKKSWTTEPSIKSCRLRLVKGDSCK